MIKKRGDDNGDTEKKGGRNRKQQQQKKNQIVHTLTLKGFTKVFRSLPCTNQTYAL